MRNLAKAFALGALLSPVFVSVALAFTLVNVIPSRHRISNRVLFVCDVSGSMFGSPFSKLLGAVNMIASQPIDAMEVAAIAFADEPFRWQPDLKNKKKTWVRLPDAKAVRRCGAWIKSQGANGTTHIIPALRVALAEPKKNLTIVLVTDGVFTETDTEVMEAIAVGQKNREKKKLGRALIAVLGVGNEMSILKDIGKLGGGYYKTIDKKDLEHKH